ncbi:MAG: hypothetical protein HYW05_03160 [Candidatus Diapherotrites archaeon]|nr:hypothetical protein [Candidatus Diapherotrites archaeon]
MARPKWIKGLERERRRKLFETERLPKSVKGYLEKKQGLGAPLGSPLPDLKVDWLGRIEKWRYNRAKLERQFPGIFTNEFFLKLPRIGGGGEGEVRHFHLGKENVFVSSSGMHWYDLIIKKFKKGARSSPENQAKTLHSLHKIYNWLTANKMLPESKNFELRVAEVIAYKGPFLAMRYIKDPLSLGQLPSDLKHEAWGLVVGFGKSIYNAQGRLIRHYESAGLAYPSPDFVSPNILIKLRDRPGEKGQTYVIDQFSETTRAKKSRFRRGSMKRIYEKRPTTARR